MKARERGRAPSVRQLRVGEEIRHCLAAVLNRGDLRDPDLRGVSITVSEVRLSPDLRNATAYVMPLGGERPGEVIKALDRAAPFLKRQVARAVQLRNVPNLTFRRDETYDEATRIDTILRSEDVAQDLGPETSEDPPAPSDPSDPVER